MLRIVGSMLVASLLVAGAARAQAQSAYEQLSPGNQMIVNALYVAQQPPQDASPLSREDLASIKSGGWGKTFKEMKDAGYYPNYKNFGHVVSSYGRSMQQGRKSVKAAAGKVRDSATPTRAKHVARIKRPDRPHRVKRPRK